MRHPVLTAAAALTLSATAHAAPVLQGEITGITGPGAPDQGFYPALSIGDPMELEWDIIEVLDITTDPDLVVQASLEFFAGGDVLIQNCCYSFVDLDPTDGTLRVEGGIGGFTGAPGPLPTNSGNSFFLDVAIRDSSLPADPFASTAAFIAFLENAAYDVTGSAGITFFAGLGGEIALAQDVFFSASSAAAMAEDAIPLPGAALLFLAGAPALVALRRRKRWIASA